MSSTNCEDVDVWFPTYSPSFDAKIDIARLSFVVVQIKTRSRRGGPTPSPPTMLAGDWLEAAPAGEVIPESHHMDRPISQWLEMARTTTSKPAIRCRSRSARSANDPSWWEIQSTSFCESLHPALCSNQTEKSWYEGFHRG